MKNLKGESIYKIWKILNVYYIHITMTETNSIMLTSTIYNICLLYTSRPPTPVNTPLEKCETSEEVLELELPALVYLLENGTNHFLINPC